RASAGTLICAAAPTSVMRSPCSRITWLVLSSPLLLSNRRPARTAITPAAGRHWNVPPSGPKQGGAPAPRQGAPGPPGSCAQSAVATIVSPSVPNTADLTAADFDLHRIVVPPRIVLSIGPVAQVYTRAIMRDQNH